MGKWLVCPSRDSQARYGGGLENHWSLTSGVRISLSAPFLHSGTSMERRWLCPIEFGSPTNNTTSVTSSHGIVKSFRRGFTGFPPLSGHPMALRSRSRTRWVSANPRTPSRPCGYILMVLLARYPSGRKRDFSASSHIVGPNNRGVH